MALLIHKSNGNIEGVLELAKSFPLEKIEKILSYWEEVSMPFEVRQKKVQREASERLEKYAREELDISKIKGTRNNLENLVKALRLKNGKQQQ